MRTLGAVLAVVPLMLSCDILGGNWLEVSVRSHEGRLGGVARRERRVHHAEQLADGLGRTGRYRDRDSRCSQSAGISVVRATPDGEGRWWILACTISPCPVAHQRRKSGSLPPPSPPPVRRAVAPGGRGTREAQPRFTWSQPTREIRVVPPLMRRFGEVLDHNGEAPPSERKALGLRKSWNRVANTLTL